jgi:hypothetical protein
VEKHGETPRPGTQISKSTIFLGKLNGKYREDHVPNNMCGVSVESVEKKTLLALGVARYGHIDVPMDIPKFHQIWLESWSMSFESTRFWSILIFRQIHLDVR